MLLLIVGLFQAKFNIQSIHLLEKYSTKYFVFKEVTKPLSVKV